MGHDPNLMRNSILAVILGFLTVVVTLVIVLNVVPG